MATQIKTVSGTTTTYTITDQKGNSMTLTVYQPPAQEITTSYAGGPILQDGAQTLTTLMQLVSTGLVP